MDCDQTQELLHSYLDGELDLARSLEVERHLEGCQSCAGAHGAYLSIRAAVNSPEQYFRAPDALQGRIRSAVMQSTQPAAAPAPRSSRARKQLRWFALAASLAIALLAIWRLGPNLGGSADRALETEILAGHVRSLMPGHLTDVASADGHSVKPWFAGKLDFSPRVVDLTASGFPLIGGRLDYIGGRNVAALVYRRRQHTINVFAWPSTGREGLRASARQGYNSVHWIRSGIEYWAISDLNEGELKQFAQLANEN